MSDRVEDWEDDGHVCQECVNKDAKIERLEAALEDIKDETAEATHLNANVYTIALAALGDDDE